VDELKRRLTTSLVLIFTDWKEPFILTTDASGTGVGGVLAQKKLDGKELPLPSTARNVGYCAKMASDGVGTVFNLQLHIKFSSHKLPLKAIYGFQALCMDHWKDRLGATLSPLSHRFAEVPVYVPLQGRTSEQGDSCLEPTTTRL